MLSNQDVVCLSSIDWDFIWQGHQEIMLRLARAGNRVLFIENTGARAPRLRDLPRLRQRWRNWRRGIRGIRKIEQGLYVYAPLVLPFPYARPARWVNRWLIDLTLRPWMKAVGFKRAIAWVFLPTPLALDLLRALDPVLTIYYCIDSFAASSPAAQKVARAEARLIRQADLVFVTSQGLHAHCARWNRKVYDFPFGVDLELFDAVMTRHDPLPADLDALPRPRVGYVGGIHQWVDQSLLRAVAQQHPTCSFVLVGPVQTDVTPLQDVANVHLLGPKPHQELPRYIQGFDVCLIPYHVTEYTKHVYPTKLNEYFALGRPVVSTALPEVMAVAREARESVLIGHQPGEFAQHLTDLLKTGDGAGRQQRRAIAEGNAWSAKLARMSQLIEEALVQRRLDQELYWTERLLAFSRVALSRLARVVCVVGVVYGAVFHTPLLWWVAAPLKLEQAPVRADTIVVFAGGVGESGQAGQGHEERVHYAVELYRAGYAPSVIFSSGYKHVFQEAQVMKALAVSLGIPAEAIVLEMEAGNTHEYVRRTASIMRARHDDHALLVSSPYHMRRAMLVAQGVAPDLTFTATPFPRSEFYGDGRRVAWHHVHAILHEYAGILYYWWRGYFHPT